MPAPIIWRHASPPRAGHGRPLRTPPQASPHRPRTPPPGNPPPRRGRGRRTPRGQTATLAPERRTLREAFLPRVRESQCADSHEALVSLCPYAKALHHAHFPSTCTTSVMLRTSSILSSFSAPTCSLPRSISPTSASRPSCRGRSRTWWLLDAHRVSRLHIRHAVFLGPPVRQARARVARLRVGHSCPGIARRLGWFASRHRPS